MGALAGVRAHVATALANVGVIVFPYSPATAVQAPCILLMPDSPYRDPGSGWGTVTVGLNVRIVVADGLGLNAQQTMDDLIDDVCDALLAANVEVGAVREPTQEPDQAVLICDIPTTTVWKDA